jgi:hypothetical protein
MCGQHVHSIQHQQMSNFFSRSRSGGLRRQSRKGGGVASLILRL